MNKALVLTALLAILVVSPGLAQEEQEMEQKVEGEAAQKGEMLRVLELPQRTKEAREAGIPEKDVREVLEAAKEYKLSPEETGDLMAESTKAAQENGNVENFGSFVKSKIGEGVRGKDLANAIHEEHKARGKGHSKGKARQEKEKHGGKAEEGKGHGDAKKHQEKEQKMQGEGQENKEMHKGDKAKGEAGSKKGGEAKKGGNKGKGGSE